ncbi:L-ribulose-5-phosphate 4-epimerase AraD [Alkalibaculum sp. M08DMB]|uniref:L-ribulose-5-phosphate 4-epimerase n=1 Tax=Alkalibaculum sporogenes TaxID=2655001 RepID=A0A6A7K7P0_9FIRM|nr:L-ribulose-5-phosphate 4-epimerase [Alkalibaculum sporogenes]MPW25372.1 L-ribulose-5-phosphate 4-epimerase AraD [Alkalibaculum sporogenes]
MLDELKEEVYLANLELPKHGLIKYTWGNVSGLDSNKELFVIKPSGVNYDSLKPSDMIVVDLNGKIIEGSLNPSSDTPTHAVLYRKLSEVRGIVHTHSPWATVWAQAGQDVHAMGTTHADTFYGTVPCTRLLTQAEINKSYEEETGNVIVDTFIDRNINPNEITGVLVHSHGPFTWGKSASSAVMNAVVLEEVCKMNLYTKMLNANSIDLPKNLLDKHFLRKHGSNAYYGQGTHNI